MSFIALIITGLVSGSLYSLMATGIVVTYSTTGIFNFAQGSVALTCAYAFMELKAAAGLPTLVSAAITVFVIAPLMALALERLVLRRLAEAPEQARIVGTIGLALAIPALLQIVLEQVARIPGVTVLSGTAATPVALGPTPSVSWKIGNGLTTNSNQVIILAAATIAAAACWWVLKRTRIGLEMRAAVDGHQLADLRGVNRARVSMAAWVLSFVLAAIVGVTGSILLGLDNNSYFVLLFISTAAAVVGRLRSVPLAFAAGLALGVLNNVVLTYVQTGFLANINGLASAIPFITLLVGLWFMGHSRGRVAGVASAASDAPVRLTSRIDGMRRRATIAAAAVVTVLCMEFVFSAFWVGVIDLGLATCIVFLSYVIVTGLGGLVSLAQAGFVTCGGLLSGWIAFELSVPLWLAAPLAIAVAVILGILVAVPAMRLSGLALSLASLAVAFILDQLIFAVPAVGNDAAGWTYNLPSIGSLSFTSNRTFSIVLVLVILGVSALINNFERSQIGRTVLAARGSRAGATASGLSVARARIAVFALSAGVASVGGFFLAQTLGIFTSTSYPAITSLLWVTIVIVIGIRRPLGAIVAGMTAAVFPQLLTYVTTSVQWPLFLFGLGALALAEKPGGVLESQQAWLIGTWRSLSGRIRHDPRRRRPASDTVTTDRRDRAPGALHLEVAAMGDATRATASSAPPTGRGLRVEDLRAGDGELEVLHGTGLAALPGEITAVFGANGSGKSTLCAAVGGTVAVREGQVWMNGELISDLPPAERMARGLYLVPEGHSVFPNLSVEQNLELCLRDQGLVAAALSHFPELAKRRRTAAGMLSGGEQQLLAMAPAMVTSPAVLIADEPMLGLAPKARRRVLDLCLDLRDGGTTVILIEERPGEVFEVANVVALIRLGCLEWQQPKAAVSAELLIASYLEAGNQPPHGDRPNAVPAPPPVPAPPRSRS